MASAYSSARRRLSNGALRHISSWRRLYDSGMDYAHWVPSTCISASIQRINRWPDELERMKNGDRASIDLDREVSTILTRSRLQWAQFESTRDRPEFTHKRISPFAVPVRTHRVERKPRRSTSYRDHRSDYTTLPWEGSADGHGR